MTRQEWVIRRELAAIRRERLAAERAEARAAKRRSEPGEAVSPFAPLMGGKHYGYAIPRCDE